MFLKGTKNAANLAQNRKILGQKNQKKFSSWRKIACRSGIFMLKGIKFSREILSNGQMTEWSISYHSPKSTMKIQFRCQLSISRFICRIEIPR